MREITEARVDVHLPSLVETRWMQSDAPLEIPVDRNPGRARVPPVAVHILKRVAVPRALHKPARLVCDVASRFVRINKLKEAFPVVYAALTKMPWSVRPSDISLLADTDPIAKDAVALRDGHPSKDPIHLHGMRLGNSTTVELWIYPRRFPMKVRQTSEGHWQVLISERDFVWLTCDSEDDARAIAAAWRARRHS